MEQFYSAEKVIRLTGSRKQLDWVTINQPEVQPDGSVRYLNDVTRSQADFVVSEQDYAGTMRTVLFDSLNALAARMPDNLLALRLLTVAMEFSDLPNNDQVADEIRKLTGERDPNKPLTPEEQQQMQQQLQAQAQALQMQQETALAALQEQQAKAREINARAEKLEAEAQQLRAAGQGDRAQELDTAAQLARRDSSDLVEQLQRQLAKAQAELANRALQIKSDHDTKLQVAHIEADSRERVAQISASNRQGWESLSERLARYEAAPGQGAQ